jgi:hypothetical protein
MNQPTIKATNLHALLHEILLVFVLYTMEILVAFFKILCVRYAVVCLGVVLAG